MLGCHVCHIRLIGSVVGSGASRTMLSFEHLDDLQKCNKYIQTLLMDGSVLSVDMASWVVTTKADFNFNEGKAMQELDDLTCSGGIACV